MSLIAHYPLTGTLEDYSGNDYHATNYGATVDDNGKIGQCYSFDGVDDIMDTTTNIIKGQSHSFSFWINRKASNATYKVILGAGQKTGVKINDTSIVAVSWGEDYVLSYSLPLDTWHHISCVYDLSKHKISIYVNGTLVGARDSYAQIAWSGNNLISLGIYGGYPNGEQYPNIKLNDVRIYDHALSEKEVKEISKAKILHYTFDNFVEPTENVIHFQNPRIDSSYSSFVATTSGTWVEKHPDAIEVYNENGDNISSYVNSGVTDWTNTYHAIWVFDQTLNKPVVVMRDLDGNWKAKSFGMGYSMTSLGLSGGDKYTISWLQWTDKLDKCANVGVYGQNTSGTNGFYDGTSSSQDSSYNTELYTWQRVYATFTVNSIRNMDDSLNIYMYGYFGGIGTIKISDVQFEVKDHATPFVNGTRTYGTIRDCSGQGNDGEVALATTPEWTEDAVIGGGAYKYRNKDFDGSTFQNIRTINTLYIPQQWTFCYWTKGTTAEQPADNIYPVGWANLCTNGPSGGTTDSRSGIIYYYDASTYRAWDPGGKNLYNGEWHHVAISYDGVTGQLSQFIDGNFDTSDVRTDLYHLLSSRYFYAGSAWSPSYGGHGGSLDDVRVYATALSEEDIKRLYQTRASLDDKGNLYLSQIQSIPTIETQTGETLLFDKTFDGYVDEITVEGVTEQVESVWSTNLVQNGDFSNGTTGWIFSSRSSVVGERAYMDGTGDAYIRPPSDIVPWTPQGKIYYIAFDLERVFGGGIQLFNNGSHRFSTTGRHSYRGDIEGTPLFDDYFDGEGNAYEGYIDNVLVVDLTEEFGVGNEPSLAECDILYANWFDGEAKVSEDIITYPQNSPSPDYPSEVNSVEGVDLVSRGKNLFEVASDIVDYFNCSKTEEDIITQTIADTREYVVWKLQTYQDNTYLDTIDSFVDNTLGVKSFTFNKTSEFNNIAFGLNGEARDTKIKIDVSQLEDEEQYTISWTVLNVIQGLIKWNKIQIELGTEATVCEPYHTPTIIPLPILRKIGDVADTYNPKTGEYVQRIGVKVFDGSENVLWVEGAYGLDYVARIVEFEDGLHVEETSPFICTHYAAIPWSSRSFLEIGEGFAGFDIGAIHFGTNLTTKADYVQYLTDQYNAGTPVVVYYQLETPIVKYYGYQQVPTFYPQTIIESYSEVSPSITASVKTDTKTYLEKPPVSPTEGLIGWWALNGNALDGSGNNNDGIVSGPETSSGLLHSSLSFDGVDDYVKIENQVVDNPEGLTISSWIYPETGGASYRCALHSGSDSSVGNSCYWLGISGSNYLTATIGARDGVGWSGGMTSVPVTYEKWTLLTATWDGATVKVYVDGQFQKSYGLGTYTSLDTDTRIGASSDGANYQYSGKIQDTRIYNRPLTEEEIETLYEIGRKKL